MENSGDDLHPVKSHTPGIPISRGRRCEICFLKCRTLGIYKDHRKMHYDWLNNRIQCPTCDATFSRPCYFRKHISMKICSKVPDETKPDCLPQETKTCVKCRITFARNDELQEHERFDRLGRKYGPRSNPPKLETWNKPPESHGDTRALSSNRPPRLELLTCPVDTCRRSFDSTFEWDTHIKKIHATWDGKCVLCGEKFECQFDLIDHLRGRHGSQDKFYAENLVRVKTELIVDEFDEGRTIKLEPDQDTKDGILPVENLVSNVSNTKCDNDVKIKLEVEQF
ncbi:uncharacterized protein LOC110860259 isoform X2 [Folsomia candida]|uniref:uncharacterized protein LOC110860259 isoform X2 n=1 Tax=Folsomia candida TaxID=158441 RepID=UPI0016050D9F|nr:uncharacterized protein LOC110860259 isoform X2 [Folsomia candida]